MPARLHSPSRVHAALEGCYETDRAAALSGVPRSTIYYWVRTDLLTPSVSMDRPRRWSFADLMTLRIVQWLRQPKNDGQGPFRPSPMGSVREALAELERMNLDIWDPEYDGPSSPLKVDRSGAVFIVTTDKVATPRGAQVLLDTLDLLGPFENDGRIAPDLLRPRPTLRIVPGKLSGEPHLAQSRITSQAVFALARRGFELSAIGRLYPGQPAQALGDAIDLESYLAA